MDRYQIITVEVPAIVETGKIDNIDMNHLQMVLNTQYNRSNVRIINVMPGERWYRGLGAETKLSRQEFHIVIENYREV